MLGCYPAERSYSYRRIPPHSAQFSNTGRQWPPRPREHKGAGMSNHASKPDSSVRYQPDEKLPAALALGLALQLVALLLPGIVLIPTTMFQAVGAADAFLLWAVLASFIASGVTTLLQAIRVGPVGAGYILTTGPPGMAISVSVMAVAAGGPALLATLVFVMALFQFVFSARLSLFRRLLTPTITGTVLMLVPVPVMPIIFNQLKNVPDGTPALAAPLSALATLLVAVGIMLKATGPLRLWAPGIGIAAGSAIAGVFGLYDVDRVAEAAWIGLPGAAWPGFDLNFGPAFWGLLPAFLFIALIFTIQTVSSAVSIQQVSWRQPRAVDFRAVQGAVAADGVGNLLCGLAGTMPNGFRPTGAVMAELTGISARSVGVILGVLLITLAFLPKMPAVLLAIPSPVSVAFITILMATIFILGIKIVAQGGIDYRRGLIVGVAFWLGVGFQSGVIFPEYVLEFAGGLLRNGMIAGGLVAIVMTLFVEVTKPRRSRLEVEFSLSALQKIRDFLGVFASRNGWDTSMANRLDAVGEEALLTLLGQDEAEEERQRRRLLLVAHKEDGAAILEFVASMGEENLQDQIALLSERPAENLIEREVSLRLLRHLASSVRHQQYHDVDIVTVRVGVPGPSPGGQT